MKRLITRMHTHLALLRHDEDGGNLIEYSLLIAFIVVAAILAVTAVGRENLSNWETVVSEL